MVLVNGEEPKYPGILTHIDCLEAFVRRAEARHVAERPWFFCAPEELQSRI